MLKNLREDIDVTIARDPAARSRLEVVLIYPGFQAVQLHRVAHGCWTHGWRLLGRVISQFSRWVTGIEIHPGARIGRRFFIDHGMGVVIGETSEIGDDVTLYHGVTLGGVSPSEDSHSQRDQKRHPTLGDNVIVGSGAQVLGPITVGHGARIGANAVVTKDVECCVTVVGIPARQVSKVAVEENFEPYGTPMGDLPDPDAQLIDGLRKQIAELQGQIGEVALLQARTDELERELAAVEERMGPANMPRPAKAVAAASTKN